MEEICVWWIGAAAADSFALGEVRSHLERAFGSRVSVHPPAARPAETLDKRRGQHSSARILQWLTEHRPRGPSKVLGLTDVDLFIPVLTFVYGEAQLGGHAAVVSTARLGAPSWNGERGLLVARLVKECVHELGHTFGLLHCSSPGCVMARSVNLLEVDRKGIALCADCGLRLAELEEGTRAGR